MTNTSQVINLASSQSNGENSATTEVFRALTSSMSSLISALNKNCDLREREKEPSLDTRQSEEVNLASVLVNMRNNTLSPSKPSHTSSWIGSNPASPSLLNSFPSSDRVKGRTGGRESRLTGHRYNTRNGTLSSSSLSSSSSSFRKVYSDPTDSPPQKRLRARIGYRNEENKEIYKSTSFPLNKPSLSAIPSLPTLSSLDNSSLLQSESPPISSTFSKSEGMQGNGGNALQEKRSQLLEKEPSSETFCIMPMTDPSAGGDGKGGGEKGEKEGGKPNSSHSASQLSLGLPYNEHPASPHPAEKG